MLTPTSKVTPHAAVLATAVEREIVLLSLATRHYYTLNESGAQIWQGVSEGLSVAEIGQRLQEAYVVTPEHAVQSVLSLLQELLAEELVTV